MNKAEFQALRESNRRIGMAHLLAGNTTPLPAHLVPPHAVPIRVIHSAPTSFMPSTTAGAFARLENSYHGVERIQDPGNLTHDLTTLIKSRT
jgi:hypothetical protein